MPLLAFLPLAALTVWDAPVGTLPPPAPADFVDTNYALTFRTPPGSGYCPLPADFVGSYHGPTLFLTRDSRCNADPSGPRIGVGYGVWFSETEVPRDPCHAVGSIRLFGRNRPLCRSEEAGMILLGARARYSKGEPGDRDGEGGYEVSVSLQTTPERLDADLATLRATAASIRVCRGVGEMVDEQGRVAGTYVSGSGKACPSGDNSF